MCSDVRNKVVELLRRLCERPDEISGYIEQRADCVADLVRFCRFHVVDGSSLNHHLKQLLSSQSEENLEECLAEFQWAGLLLEGGLSTQFGGKSEQDLRVMLGDHEIPVEVYAPHAALAPIYTWHDRVKTAFLRTVSSRFHYGLFPEASPGGCTPPSQDPSQLGVSLAQVVDRVQPVGNERLHIYVGPSLGQLNASQACVLRVEDERPSESIRCALGPNLGDSVPSMLEFRNEQFDCQVPKCRDVSGVTGQLAVTIRDTTNRLLGPRQCARVAVFVPERSPLRRAIDPSATLSGAWDVDSFFLGTAEMGLMFHASASGCGQTVFAVLPQESDPVPNIASWHRVRMYLNGKLQSFVGSVVVYGSADKPEVTDRILGCGGYGANWLSEKLEKKARQLPDSGGILAVVLRGGIHVSKPEVAAFLGRPEASINAASGSATLTLDMSSEGAGVFAKYDRVKAVFLAKLDSQHCRISEVTYAPSPLAEAGMLVALDSLAKRIQVSNTCRWNTTGATWEFTISAVNDVEEPGW